jgi:hypothetical protein
MPDLDAGPGIRTAIKILAIVGDRSASQPRGTWLPTPDSLLSLAAPAAPSRAKPAPSESNHALKSALFLSAFAGAGRPGQPHLLRPQASPMQPRKAALICLARRRTTSCSPCSATEAPTRRRSTTALSLISLALDEP